MSKFKRTKKYYQGTMEGKPVTSEEDSQLMRKRLIDGPSQLSENDFSKSGEMIPKDAGLLDFMKYNASHFDPSSPENALNMTMGMGAIGKIKHIPGMHMKSGAKEFTKAIQQAMEHSPLHKQNITPYGEAEYATFKTFLAPDGKSGFAIKPSGELVNVFSVEKGRGKNLVEEAVKQGASKLDAFNINEKLPELYKKGGFETYKTEKNWTPGGPDVNYMALRDKHPDLFSTPRPEPVPSHYDPRKEALEQMIGKLNPKNEFGYREPRPIKHLPEVPEFLKKSNKTLSSEKTPVMEIDPNASKIADEFEHSIDHPTIAPKPDVAPKLPEKPFGADMPNYQETDKEALERMIGYYEDYGQFPSPKKPKLGNK